MSFGHNGSSHAGRFGQCRSAIGRPAGLDQTSTTSYRVGMSGFPISRRSAAVARLMCLRLAASTASIGMRMRWSALPRRRLVLTSTMQRIPASLRQTMSSSPSLPGARQFLQRMSYPAFWRKFAAAVSPACPTLHARVLSLRIRLGRSFPAAFASLLNIAPMMRIYSACPPDGKYWSG